MPPGTRDGIRDWDPGSEIGSGMRALGLPFDRIGILAGLQAGPDLSLTATDQLHEFLRRRHIAAKFAALLRHRTTKACRMLWGFRPVICLQGRIDPQLVTPGRMFRLAGSAGRGLVANVYVATTHDGCPLLRRLPTPGHTESCTVFD